MNIGLFFGSFNPIHIGHLIIANAILSKSRLDKIWFVVSPHNPLKTKSSLLHIHDRIQLVREAIHHDYNFEICDIEARMTMPSYTINTLVLLDEKYPQHKFCLIVGQDNLVFFHKWKNHEEIVKRYKLYIYPRINSKKTVWDNHNAFEFVDAPLISISSSYIRKLIKINKSVKYILPTTVEEMVLAKGYYR